LRGCRRRHCHRRLGPFRRTSIVTTAIVARIVVVAPVIIAIARTSFVIAGLWCGGLLHCRLLRRSFAIVVAAIARTIPRTILR